MTKRRIDTHGFWNITLFSCIIGTGAWMLVMMGVAGLVMTLERIGVSIVTSWDALWYIALVLSLVSPFPFVGFVRKHFLDFEKVHKGLILFNAIEYTCLTISFLPIFVEPDTFFNSGDGQVAISCALAGWMAIPVLYIINHFSERMLKRLRKAGK